MTQQEYNNITLLSNRITATTRARRYTYGNDHYKDIISHLARMDVNKKGSITPFINNLEITEVFKDEDGEEGASIIDLIR